MASASTPQNASSSTGPPPPSSAISSTPPPGASPTPANTSQPTPVQANPPSPATPATPSVTPTPSAPPTPPAPSTPSASPPDPVGPPPSPPLSPPPSPPLSPPPLTPPSASSPPPLPSAPPPAVTIPPPALSPPPPSRGSPPPQTAPVPPAATPPPTQAVSSSPPPPITAAPPTNVSPTPPAAPEGSPAPPAVTTPSPPPPQNANAPSAPTLSPPPAPISPSLPSTSPPTNQSVNGSSPSPPLPSLPTSKPTAASPSPNATMAARSTNSGGISTGAAVGIGVVVSILALSLMVMAVWFVKKRKKTEAGVKVGYAMPSPFASSDNSDALFLRPQSSSPALVTGSSGGNFMYSPSEPGAVGNSRSTFTYDELVDATNGFSDKNLLGEGGFGSVFKGHLVDGREVAVKQLKIGGGQGEREFRAEVEIISRVHHRHLVSLVGYCISEHQRLLVYDYVPNDTLHSHLHGQNRPVMDWATRFRVATGSARGIAYLHEDCHPRIIHRDIKSSNILLDNNFEAQVADFGLAKLALDANTHVTTRVMGTFGYMAPEYASSGKLTEKSDVFSYGVVLLELITGRKPVDASQPLGDESLVEWARPLLSQALDNENFDDLVDSKLEKNYIETEMFRMIEAAAACVRHSASKRPRMSQVVRALDSMSSDESDLSNGMRPGQSEMFGPSSTQMRMFQRMAFGSHDYSSDFYEQSQTSWSSQSGNWHSRV